MPNDDADRPATSEGRVIGRQEMLALTSSVVAALERAGLLDMLAEVKRRVMDRKPEDVCDSEETSEALVFHLTYKPIVELLLYEVRDSARMPHLAASKVQ